MLYCPSSGSSAAALVEEYVSTYSLPHFVVFFCIWHGTVVYNFQLHTVSSLYESFPAIDVL